MIDIVFIHGWGFDKTIWQPIVERLEGVKAHYVDLGFTGKKYIPDFPNTPFIIGHSMGVMWAIENIPQPWTGLISIAGFDCFYEHVPATEIKKMQRNLMRNPQAQMNGFWQACGIKNFCDVEKMNIDNLHNGLDLLENKKTVKPDCPTVCLAAKNDIITPPQMIKKIWGDNVKWCDEGDHAIPITKPEWCVQSINDFILQHCEGTKKCTMKDE